MYSAAAKPKRGPLGQAVRECPICGSPHLEYEFIVDRSPVCACQECGLLFLNPQPRDAELDEGVAPLESHILNEIYQANAAERLH